MSTKEAGHSKTLCVLWCVCESECNYSWRVNFLYDAVVSSLILLQLMNICLDRSRHSVLAMKCSRNVSVGVVWNEKVSRRRRSKKTQPENCHFSGRFRSYYFDTAANRCLKIDHNTQ